MNNDRLGPSLGCETLIVWKWPVALNCATEWAWKESAVNRDEPLTFFDAKGLGWLCGFLV